MLMRLQRLCLHITQSGGVIRTSEANGIVAEGDVLITFA